MLQISPITFTANEKPKRLSEEQREDIRDTAVAGGAAGAGYTAAKNGGLRMTNKLKQASSTVKETTKGAKQTIRTINEGKKALTGTAAEAKGLFSRFKINAKNYTDNMINSLKNMKAGKFVQRIVNTRVVRYGCGIFGGVLAGCVLLSGLGPLYSNTTKIVDNYAPRLADNLNHIAEQYNKNDEE